jgi:hypothetical protein
MYYGAVFEVKKEIPVKLQLAALRSLWVSGDDVATSYDVDDGDS